MKCAIRATLVIVAASVVPNVAADCWVGKHEGEHNITDFETCPLKWITSALQWKLENPVPVPSDDPYKHGPVPTAGVCGVTFTNATHYRLDTFTDKETMKSHGAFLTHDHACGLCSSLQDLAVYMRSPDMTGPVRKCALKGIVSKKWAMNCIVDLGYSPQCSAIWYYNTRNTRKECFSICTEYYALGVPNNVPNDSKYVGDEVPQSECIDTSCSCSLNKCLQCDEDKSGPVFKSVAGRARRNSGLTSKINRNVDVFAYVSHSYLGDNVPGVV